MHVPSNPVCTVKISFEEMIENYSNLTPSEVQVFILIRQGNRQLLEYCDFNH